MPLAPGQLQVGPVRCAWQPYRHGEPAEPLVRTWLAVQLGGPPASLHITREMHGRPLLGAHHGGFDTSWSHSGDGLLMALAADVRIGIDLEFERPRPKAQVLANRFFAASEAATLAALPDDAREAAFVRLWCAKEAVLKAHGQGLSFGLHRLVFAPEGEDWALVDCDPALGAPGDWTLHAFRPAPDYLATVAWRPHWP
ncbi:4'-phosphopantetheinyl transferase superfamily protein [Luteimonas sp. MC1572]|uniref:4'-phosphopantetheinyl transferase family protein n=1 Tax=Luteimonas sp. MC1572 TaxID=2799325 RepID=UPI0018F0C490|nr:4'-phosphopantetheinyl transferase superfamily protein [Luteimonas sp. MC1572]MBJ6981779.1 4'-phosphopantetheinyl transferase superfamily protein [Luteimonas sp. MC1572]QQO03063.1 4'-phosphopantetheinyl transferase superfamily protein [Luteimonas sp. MC1572]